jgi:hypothetical protein
MFFGTRPRIASYFMLEAQTGDCSVGRVLRFDSFSKILSSGIRTGFVTGPVPLLDAIDRHVSHATQVNPFALPLTECLHVHWADGYRKLTAILLLPSHNPHLTPFVGPKRLPRPRPRRSRVLSRQARRVRGGHATAPPRHSRMEYPRSRDVFLACVFFFSIISVCG